jgi:lipid II:glycine glycyltransferase (peptidoglycan interpeptide bridge formation enzyme)
MIEFKKIIQNKKEWDFFVNNHPKGRFEHKIAFINFLLENKRKVKNYDILQDNKKIGIISLIKEKKLFFKRYSSQGMLLNEKINRKEVLNEIKKKFKNVNYIKINNFKTKISKNKIVPATFILNVKNKSLEEIFNSKLESRAKRAIKKAIKNKLKIKISNSTEELEKFYPIYLKKMKEFKNIPYSLNSLKKLIKNKEYTIFNVFLKNKVIAGGTMMIYKNMITNHLASSDNQYLNLSPNNFLYYQMIKFAKENNLNFVNYGPSLRKDNVAKFKISMGGKPIEFEEHIIINYLMYKLFSILSFISLKLKKII